VLLQVQRSGDMGSPRVAGSISFSKAPTSRDRIRSTADDPHRSDAQRPPPRLAARPEGLALAADHGELGGLGRLEALDGAPLIASRMKSMNTGRAGDTPHPPLPP